MKTIKKFKNNELLTFTEDKHPKLIKIYIDDNYENFYNIKKGYKINLINSNKGLYKGSFMNNYVCKKIESNQKVNLTNIETNKILNYCKYFLLSQNEYVNLNLYNNYKYIWFLRSSYDTSCFTIVDNYGNINYLYASYSNGFVPVFLQERRLKNEDNKNF